MEHYDKIIEELEQFGFKKENDLFIYDNVTYNTMIINGQQFHQPQHNYIYLRYEGEGCIMDEDCDESDDSTTLFSEFAVLDNNKEPITFICVTDINDIKFFLNLCE